MLSNFTNIYPVTKTLRFELIPEKETLINLERDGIIKDDEARSVQYKVLKKLMDRYYKKYLEDALQNAILEGLDEYESLFFTSNRTDLQNKEMEEMEQNLRDQVCAFLTSDEKYKKLFKKEMVVELLPEILEDEGEKEIVKNFNKFTTFCVGFFENRSTMFSNEDKSSTIAHRIVNENLPKFLLNRKLYANKIRGIICSDEGNIDDRLLAGTKYESIDDVFDLDNFSLTMTQIGITAYNGIIGGYTTEAGEKIQGLNELINLHNQKKIDSKVAKLQPLYKQILSDSISISFIPEQFEKDIEVLEAVNGLYLEFDRVRNDIYETFVIDDNCSTDGIFVKNNTDLTSLSNELLGSWSAINEALFRWYRENIDDSSIDGEKYIEKRKKYFDKQKSYSISFLSKVTNTNPIDQLRKLVNSSIESVLNKYENAKDLLNSDYDSNRKLIYNDIAIGQIKQLLDELKSLEKLYYLLKGTGKEAERDAVFYGRYVSNDAFFLRLNEIYNKVRNYATQKPYSDEKFKITFSRSDFLNTWEADYNTKSAIMFEKEGKYYVGIVAKKIKGAEAEYLSEGKCDGVRLLVDVQKPDNKNTPRLFIRSKGDNYAPAVSKYDLPIEDVIELYDQGKFKTEYRKKNPVEYKESLSKLIDYFKLGFSRHESYKDFDFKWRETSEYENIAEFYEDTVNSCYRIKKLPVNFDHLLEYCKQGKIYLFQIYNKDFSQYSTGKPNLHTMYFKALFSEENAKNVVYKINGEAEMFYRRKSISDSERIIHKAGEPIKNKNSNNDKESSSFDYDIVKDRRFTVDKMQIHIPVTMNFQASGRYRLNAEVQNAIRKESNMHIIGIDRGERHLLYVSVIDLEGNIIEQFSLNDIIAEYNNQKHSTSYHKLLDEKEKARLEARQEWKTIETIKELKAGYMSQVVHVIAQLILKYNAIVVLEDLNSGFKRGRQKIEKQVYQNFEKALINKLNYYVDKEKSGYEPAGLYNALQLTDEFRSFSRLGRQSGILFYVPAWNTSKIDPSTGFANFFNTKYESVEKAKVFWGNFDDISYNGEYFEFSFDYDNFTERAKDTLTKWTVCSYGERVRTFRNPEKNSNWDYEVVNPTEMLTILLNNYNIDYRHGSIKDAIINISEKEFYISLFGIFKLIVQMRNSIPGSDIDYIISPIKADEGFYDSRIADKKLPNNADANGAYNIARKGLWAVKQIKKSKENENINLAISNKEWLNFVQK